MKIELVFIIFVGLGLPLFAFLSGLYYLKKNQRREDRINHVVTQVMDSPGKATNLLHRLLKSDVLDLENGKEIFEACDRIQAQGGKNPIPDHDGLLSDDLKPFLTYIFVHKIDLSDTSIQKVIQTFRDKIILKAAA